MTTTTAWSVWQIVVFLIFQIRFKISCWNKLLWKRNSFRRCSTYGWKTFAIFTQTMCQKLIENVEVMWVFDSRFVIVDLSGQLSASPNGWRCAMSEQTEPGQLGIMSERSRHFALENYACRAIEFWLRRKCMHMLCKRVECSLRHLERAQHVENSSGLPFTPLV